MTEEERAQRRERILACYQEMGSIRGVVRQLHVSIHTVRRVLRGQDEASGIREKGVRRSPLEPYRAVVERLVREEKLTAVLVHEELHALGFTGSYASVKRFVRTVRPCARRRVTTRLEHPPGAEGQVDWSPYTVSLGGMTTIIHAFSLVLPFSRFMVVRFALDEQLDTLLMLHEEAFEVLGGIPAVMTYDYVSGHIIVVLCPPPICGHLPEVWPSARICGLRRPHNIQSESSQARSDSSLRQTGLCGNVPEIWGGSQARSAASLA